MQWDKNYGIRTALVPTDLSVANGAIAVPALTDYKPIIRRIWGKATGNIVINRFNGTANTALTQDIVGSNNLDIPGLELFGNAGDSIRITGTDTASELHVQFAYTKNN